MSTDQHEDVEARLRALLGGAPGATRDLDEQAVEEILRRGTRGRRRRAAAVVASGVTAVVLVGAGVVAVPHLFSSSSTVQVATEAPSTPVESAPAPPTPTPSLTTKPTPRSDTDPQVLAAFPAQADLGDLTYMGVPMFSFDEGQGAMMATAMGAQICDPTVVGPADGAVFAQVGAYVGATRPGATPLSMDSADFTVTRYADERGWNQLVQDSGKCRWFQVSPTPWVGDESNPDKIALVGPQEGPGIVPVGAIQRVGTTIIAVVYRSTDVELARREAVRLSDLMVQRVREGAAPVEFPADPFAGGATPPPPVAAPTGAAPNGAAPNGAAANGQ